MSLCRFTEVKKLPCARAEGTAAKENCSPEMARTAPKERIARGTRIVFIIKMAEKRAVRWRIHSARHPPVLCPANLGFIPQKSDYFSDFPPVAGDFRINLQHGYSAEN
jgi:hypothetical protein